MKKILILRFSAMGDVALVLPVLLNVLKQNPNLEITLVTREKFKTFFDGYENIHVFSPKFDSRHKGFLGLFRLFLDLNKLQPDYLFDLHQNIRTQILKFFFTFTSAKILGFSKGRSEKRKLTKNKEFGPLAHVTERYLEVFTRSGLVQSNSKIEQLDTFFKSEESSKLNIEQFLSSFPIKKLIGIAPFAQHKGKVWPIEKYQKLIQLINKEFRDVQFFIFGGGKSEYDSIETLIKYNPEIVNLVGKFTLSEEIELIKRLDVMVCGDSSNMHFAALSNIPVVSIWGSTHVYAGFGALFQPETNTIEISKQTLECRPCSIYGNKPCVRGDYACLEWIEPNMVLDRLKPYLG